MIKQLIDLESPVDEDEEEKRIGIGTIGLEMDDRNKTEKI